MKNTKKLLLIGTVLAVTLVLAGCSKNSNTAGTNSSLKGTVKADGSSTVFPITEAVGEEFQKENPNVRVTIGTSGTGGGFEKFCVGETDISDASRPIKNEEKEACAKNNVEYVDIEVAYDGISVVVNKNLSFINSLTVKELKKIWEPGSKIKKWSDIRNTWPKKEINLYGPGTDSGTFDYFTKAIVGKDGASRPDYTASEDDNVLVQGISRDKNSLGYFGFAYYTENKDKLKVISVDNGGGAVKPNAKTIKNGKYAPLSRPIFIYVNKKSLKEKPEVAAFAKYYLETGKKLVEDVGYIMAPSGSYKKSLAKLNKL